MLKNAYEFQKVLHDIFARHKNKKNNFSINALLFSIKLERSFFMQPEFIPYKTNEGLENYFYMIPAELLASSLYRGKLNSDSILLYGILQGLIRESYKNKMIDENGYIYVQLTRKKAQKILGLSDKTICKAFNQLRNANLIQEKKMGFNKANRIYISKVQHLPEETNLNRKNYDSGIVKSTSIESENLRSNNIIYNNINTKS